MSKHVVVLSPNPFGDYAICTAEMLARRGIKISAIYVRRLADPLRLIHDVRREGVRSFASKVARKLLFRNAGARTRPFETLGGYKQRKGIADVSLRALAERHGAEYRTCSDFNERDVCAEIAASTPDAVVFTGGGLIRARLIAASAGHIIACHPGYLPHYRGMDCLEWALFEGRSDLLGLSTFLIDAGVDTGPILSVYPVQVNPADLDFATMRERLEPAICEALVESVAAFLDEALLPTPQEASEGRQFFAMHPRVAAAADKMLREMRPRQ